VGKSTTTRSKITFSPAVTARRGEIVTKFKDDKPSPGQSTGGAVLRRHPSPCLSNHLSMKIA
jgi:hypothetical protein